MSVTFVRGDIRKTAAQAILLGLNIRGQVEVNPLEVALRDSHPVFFSEYRRMGRSQRFIPGQLWIFREAAPWLGGMMVMDSANSPPRLRHVEQALLTLRRDWQREGLTSIAIARIGDDLEWSSIRALFEEYLSALPIPVIVYETHIPEQKADEPL